MNQNGSIDDRHNISVESASIAEGETKEIQISRTSREPVTAKISLIYGTGYYVSDNASSNDVSLSSQQVNFEGGQTTATIELTAIDDSAVESTETLKLRASVGPTDTFPYSAVTHQPYL